MKKSTNQQVKKRIEAVCATLLIGLAFVQAFAFTTNPAVESRSQKLAELQQVVAKESMEFALTNAFPELREGQRKLNARLLKFPDRPLSVEEEIHLAAMEEATDRFQPILQSLLKTDLTVDAVKVHLAAHMIQGTSATVGQMVKSTSDEEVARTL